MFSGLSKNTRRRLLAIHLSNAAEVDSAFALGRPLLVHLQTVFDGLQLKIILKPELGVAIVFDTLLLAERLSDEE
jgi:hypothetical protein